MNKIIDCHCHIYPDRIAAKAVDNIGNFYNIKMNGGGTLQDLKTRMSRAGVTNCLIFSVATTPHQVKSINEFIAANVNASGGMMKGLGTLHPDSEDIEGDVCHLSELGLKGVKLHPDFLSMRIDDERMQKIYSVCEGRLPILFHCGDYRYDYSNPNRLIPMIKKYPGLKIIAAHFGGWSIWKQAAEKLCGYENLTVDCSSSFYGMTNEEALGCIRLFGAERVLFGTDFPMWDPEEEVRRFYSLGLEKWEQDCIFFKNAEKIFGNF